VTPAEAAKALDMNPRFLDLFIRSGTIATEPDGSITPEEFEDFRQRREAARREMVEAIAAFHAGRLQEAVIDEMVREMEDQ
jgi:hypothetical protein